MSKPFSDLSVANLVVKFGEDGNVESVQVGDDEVYRRPEPGPVEVSRGFGHGSDVDRDAEKWVPDTAREVLIRRDGITGYLVGRWNGAEWYRKANDGIFYVYRNSGPVTSWREI